MNLMMKQVQQLSNKEAFSAIGLNVNKCADLEFYLERNKELEERATKRIKILNAIKRRTPPKKKVKGKTYKVKEEKK